MNKVRETKAVLMGDVAVTYPEKELVQLQELYIGKIPHINEQEIVEGEVIKIKDKEVIVDLGAKSDGVIPITEFRDLPHLKEGDKVNVYVEQQEDMQGNMIVSRKKASLIRAWEALEKALDAGEVLQALVKRKIKGGLVLDIQGIEVFLPGSQIDVVPIADFDQFVGNKLEVQVAKINPEKANVVVSRKMVIEKGQAEQRKEIISKLQEGQVLSGIVKNITGFGIFIDLGGITGLLHKRDMAWFKNAQDLETATDENGHLLFAIGSPIEVVVKGFELDKGHITLSTKLLYWDQLSDDIQENSAIKVIVEEIEDSYALVKICEGIVGLLHISEMSYSNHIKHPNDLLTVGEEIDVMVLSRDDASQSIRVGIKQLHPDPWESEMIDQFQIESRHKGKVRTVTNSGAYIELVDGVEGFLHVRHFSWTKKVQHPSEMIKKGDEIEVMVLAVDREGRLLSLGLRELEENPWPSLASTFQVGSTHNGTIVTILSNGAIVELPYGVQCFVPNKDLVKENKKKPAKGEDLAFFVFNFFMDEHKMLVSHTATYKKRKKGESQDDRESAPRSYTDEKTTFGEHSMLQKLKKELEEQTKEKK